MPQILGPSNPDAGSTSVDGSVHTPDAGSIRVDAGTSSTDGGSTNPECLASSLMQALGRQHVLVGAQMQEATAGLAPFDLRYIYIAGTIPDGDGPCTSCASGCTSNGQSCANSAGCGWWGCWQWDQDPPGKYVRDFIRKAQEHQQLPMLTFYQVLQASGASEGSGEVIAANDVAFMTRFLIQWRFLLQQVGSAPALLHVEPDFWGYVEHQNEDANAIPAAVASANPQDCGHLPNTMAGLGRCFIAMARTYAPQARIGLHASGWGTRMDVLANSNASFDVEAEARKLGRFLRNAGATEGDFIVLDALDRDAGYYQSQGRNRWWDETNATLPNFHQAFTWAHALSVELGLPHIWWQLPVGNMSLPNVTTQWKDNRVDYMLGHLDEVAAAGGFAVAFGAGASGQTTPETDNGNLVSKVQAYAQSGRQSACP